MASTLLTACCSGVTCIEQTQVPHKVTKRFTVLKVNGTIIADETHDFPLGAIAHYHFEEDDLLQGMPLKLTIAETVPNLEPHCKPKLNHIDPFPVYPKGPPEAPMNQLDTDTEPGEAAEFTWEDIEARQDSSEEETPAAEDSQKKLRRGKQRMVQRRKHQLKKQGRENWLRSKRREVEEKWKTRGYLLRCAVTTGGHAQPLRY